MGQRKSRIEIASLARGHTESVIKMLVGIVTREDAAPNARIAAGLALLDRGWGKPSQNLNLHDDRPRFMEIINEIVDPEDPDNPELLIERPGPNGWELLPAPAAGEPETEPQGKPEPKEV